MDLERGVEQMSMKKKLRNRSGFTLAETLIAVLILLMASSIITAGIPVARNAYEKIVLTSNAQALLSTTVSALRNELGTAQDVKVEGTKIQFFNSNSESTSLICLNSDLGDDKISDEEDGTIVFQRYTATDWSTGQPAVRLVSKEAASKNSGNTADLYVTYQSVTFDGTTGILTFKDLTVNRSSTAKATITSLPSLETLSIRVVSQ